MTVHQILSLSLRKPLLYVLGVVLMVSLIVAPVVHAQTSGSTQRDCDENAVLRCGAYTTAEINQKYDSQAGAKTIYNNFGISSTEVSTLHDTAVSGYVTKGGRVLIGDKTVATDALTVGRQNMPGSNAVTQNDATFYTRPPIASFNQNKLDAYVVMKNGQFQYAIIKSCGNPVKATPVAVDAPEPAPAPVQPQAAPPAPVAPVASSAECQLINVTTTQNRQVSVTANSSSSNAQIIGYVIDFGDGSAPASVQNSTSVDTVSATSSSSATSNSSQVNIVAGTSPAVTHQYATDGTYTITASVQVRYPDGRVETKSGVACKQSVTFTTAPVVPAGKTEVAPPPPAAPPQALPATGAGEVAGVSAAVGLASVVGYGFYGWLSRRFGLQ